MTAAIDIGNTRCKIGFFENDSLIKLKTSVAFEAIVGALKGEEVSEVIVSSVGKDVSNLGKELSEKYKVVKLTHLLPLPIFLDYSSTDTLGTDRIAAVAGAFHLYRGKNCLVIDVGSCITYDIITSDGYYKGGAISPGVEMKLKSMHTFTARLPFIEHPEWVDLPGKDTKTSMINGVLHGTLAEIEGMIERFSGLLPDLQVIMCGGGSNFFESNIKHHIFVRSELVLIGLNSILRHNERN
ncbi:MULTISPECIES: type III pantothenate kinase [unclassified Imperialibacter]|uniref:type III pantothenate kinase n=1 Tax=unclassified Imperialibacter TaxID=2629706 RepID=UPI0012586FF9|nr:MULTISPECIES: type III pantothenate kinase [unclassified Imperialibacter]CAD5271783.1 Type III pantothenate kinase [Imperialibacter sp. 89]CAD5299033.1 Type III pantothenate kinase [Imperialibacter sp. 75]VVT35127.1 Type III pantothenate kinase [Imperialibacter sp. EC-SDR9]